MFANESCFYPLACRMTQLSDIHAHIHTQTTPQKRPLSEIAVRRDNCLLGPRLKLPCHSRKTDRSNYVFPDWTQLLLPSHMLLGAMQIYTNKTSKFSFLSLSKDGQNIFVHFSWNRRFGDEMGSHDNSVQPITSIYISFHVYLYQSCHPVMTLNFT